TGEWTEQREAAGNRQRLCHDKTPRGMGGRGPAEPLALDRAGASPSRQRRSADGPQREYLSTQEEGFEERARGTETGVLVSGETVKVLPLPRRGPAAMVPPS